MAPERAWPSVLGRPFCAQLVRADVAAENDGGLREQAAERLGLQGMRRAGRQTMAQHTNSDPFDDTGATSPPPGLGLTVPPPRSTKRRMAAIAAGTVIGVAILLTLYRLTIDDVAVRTAATNAPWSFVVDLSSPKRRAAALSTVADLVRRDVESCVGRPPDEVSMVLQRGSEGRFVVVSLANLPEEQERRCVIRGLQRVEVLPSPHADEPWPVAVVLAEP